MAQEPETERDSSGIARAGKRKWGYDTAQVDAFLERAHSLYEGEYDSEGVQLTQHDIQNVSFDMRKGGYLFEQVDAALDRLERAVVDKQTSWEIGQQGRVAWKARTEELYRQVAEHAERADRERFADGAHKKPSYDRKQVDRLVDRIVGKASEELQIENSSFAADAKGGEVDSKTVSRVVFTQRKGDGGYDERQVDYFLSSCVQLLSRLESYDRISQYDDEQADSAQPAPIANNASNTSNTSNNADSIFNQDRAASGVTPLFAAAPQEETASYAPVHAGEETESFAALNKAEQAIYTASTAQESAPSFAPSTPSAPKPSAPSAYDYAAPEGTNVDDAAASAAPIASAPEASTAAPEPDYATIAQHGDAPVASTEFAYAAGSSNANAPAEAAETASIFSGTETAAETTAAVPAQAEWSGAPAADAVSAAPIPSFQPALPAQSAVQNGNGQHTEAHTVARAKETDATLAALAHMAEVSQELPKVSATVPAPKVPSLQTFGMPHFAADPVPSQRHTDDDADDAADKSSMFPKADEDMDLDIPDLSFPGFDGDSGDSNSTDAVR
jgi:DivIVA domain-containing protein